jgi:hypothetical protein
MNFLSPDAHLTPNPIVNACSLAIIGVFIVACIAKLFIKLIVETDKNLPTKQKIFNYITLTLVSITLILLFFPLYNILRTVMNPEPWKNLIN